MSKIFLSVKLLVAHGEQCHFNGRNWNLDKFFFRSIENFQKFVMKNGNFSWKKKVSTFLGHCTATIIHFFVLTSVAELTCIIDGLSNWLSKLLLKSHFSLKKKSEKIKGFNFDLKYLQDESQPPYSLQDKIISLSSNASFF